MKNGDYLCMPFGDHDAWNYMGRKAIEEGRFKVCLRGGVNAFTEYGIECIETAIWVLRK